MPHDVKSQTPQVTYSEAVCRYGSFRYFTFDDPIGKSLIEYGEWAETEIAFIASFLKGGDTVVDVGANIGTHSVALAKCLGPSGKLYAVEPQFEVYELLKSNIELNCEGLNVIPVNACAGDTMGEERFPVLDYSQHANFGGVHALPSSNQTDNYRIVPQITLDSLNLQKCDFIKLDAEGFELGVLKGSNQLISKFEPVVYAECNSLELGYDLLNWFQEKGYSAYYHETPAFNPKNFRANTNNFFGSAHETSLLFIKEEKIDSRRLPCQNLFKINDSNDFENAFAASYRFGDNTSSPTSGRLKLVSSMLVNELSSSQSHKDCTDQNVDLLNSLIVIIPVFNAPNDLIELLNSLSKSIPTRQPGLAFMFCDDNSTDLEIMSIFSTHPFLNRMDVLKYRRPTNQGFVKNVNNAFTDAMAVTKKCDVLILNSDTQIFPNLINALQKAAYSAPNVASVTPLTNNGTIASILNWPTGSEVTPSVPIQSIAQALEQLNRKYLPFETVIPVGVGFCMYIRREALDAVGIFDEIYGKGYGEECDWCRRAAALGFENLLTTRAFVYHSGGKSFGHLTKQASIAANSEILISKFPDYDYVVSRFVQLDPTKFVRILLALESLKLIFDSDKIHLFTLHSDLDQVFAGGTEAHARYLRKMLLDDERAVLVLAPKTPEQFVLRGMICENIFLEETFHKDILLNIILVLEQYVGRLHVHHTIGWPQEALQVLSRSTIKAKSITAHDFWLLCPSITLLGGPDKKLFCGVETDKLACNSCLRANWPETTSSIDNYRDISFSFLKEFDNILLPSTSMLDYFSRAFGTHWAAIKKRTHVVSHNLLYIFDAKAKFFHVRDTLDLPALESHITAPARIKPKITFIGAIGEHKGSNILLDAIPQLEREGFTIEILGFIYPNAHSSLKNVVMTPYKNIDELAKLLLTGSKPDIICSPSICAETFCFTFFEGLILCPTAVPVVGPFGNPAVTCKNTKIGVVMNGADTNSLINAVKQAYDKRADFQPKLQNYVQTLTAGVKLKSHLAEYLAATDIRFEKTPADHATNGRDPLLKNLAKINPMLSEQSTYPIEINSLAIKLAVKLQKFFRRNRRFKSATISTMKFAWRIVKTVRRQA